MTTSPDQKSRWDKIYGDKPPEEMRWSQNRPDLSTRLIHKVGLGPDATILDIGGGASTLVDHLLVERRYTLAVLDISQFSLVHG
jgi:cyclopropane fatty-acyl-phospholipid synthase-like methyltransferase